MTDEKSIEVTAMVLNGLINTRILAICRDLDIEAVGISGVDAGLVRAHRRAPGEARRRQRAHHRLRVRRAMSTAVNTGGAAEAARQWTDAGREPARRLTTRACCSTSTPIRSPRRIGAAVQAEKLILCTGAPGILENAADPGSLISYTDLRGLQRLRAAGSLQDGMLPKAQAIEDAHSRRRAPRARRLL